ncbi:uncharacterized protein LOC119740315 [Patiria miniata]|uniref:T-box domain-containing protein n=1 Tax=Patiria miniata TaxID=46514 RepID=A0A914B5Y1_PATMI|nr:uncharacterized protein LOC119740315 [Patiria miniata]
MELSQNAKAFSIQSLIATSSEIDKDDRDRRQTAEIYSHSSGLKPLGTGSVDTESYNGGPAGPSESTLSDSTDKSLVHRTASLLRGISMHDDVEGGLAGAHPPSSPPVARQGFPLTNLNIVGQRSVRPKVRCTGDLYPDEGISGSGSKQKAGIGWYPDESHGRPLERRFLLGADYMLTDPPCPVQHPSIKDVDPTPGKDGMESVDMETADQPISKCVDGIQVTLENSKLWKMFNKCGTEMIVNRIGRRMFPCVVITMLGMDPTTLYRVQMELDASDRRRYKFINGKWVPVGKADAEPPNKLFEHPDSPSLGAFWMQDRVSFAKLKITNNKETGGTNTVLHSMHRYTPRIIITQLRCSSANVRGIAAPCSDPNLPTEGGVPHYRQLPAAVGGSRPSCFEFEETAFIAVTAYHSEQITQLKIQNNPFAKAFRDADIASILQNSYVHSEPNESTIPPTCRGVSMRMAVLSQGMKPVGPNVAEYYPPVERRPLLARRTIRVPKFPAAPWSFDTRALARRLRPSGTYAHAADRNADAMRQSRGPSQEASSQHGGASGRLPAGQRRPKIVSSGDKSGASFHVQADATNRSATTSKFSEFRQAVSDNLHPLRRVSSTAVTRAVKRHSLPYFSSKKVVYIPRYGSADNATFEKSHDQHELVPRRHSIVEGLPKFFRASTGNLRSKMEAEQPAICGPPVVLSPTSKMAGLAASSGDCMSASTSTVASADTTACASSSK